MLAQRNVDLDGAMAGPGDDTAEQRREAWQARLLPLMAGMVVAAALFFAVVSVIELRALYPRIEQRPLDLASDFAAFEQAAPEAARGDVDYLRFKTLALLEADALHRRYHQATAMLLARVWTRQLGFVTGMILALVGAAFVLGRLQERASTVEFDAKVARASIVSASPGLVLAVLGSVLMGLALVVRADIATHDVATYVRAGGAPSDAASLNGFFVPGPIVPPDPGSAPRLPSAPTTTQTSPGGDGAEGG